jgi:L-rhamnose-H+ transport protein
MMTPNPFRGVVFHWLGGLASGSFYVPFRGVRKWAWEVYWLAGGFFSWIIAPWILALVKTEDLLTVLRSAPPGVLLKAYIFGALWGVGGLTFGLTMRYLGMSLGMGVALGYCAVIGTLVPPILHHEFASKVLGTTSGLVILIGIVVCVLGIAAAGMAGMSKERELTQEEKRSSIKEFNFLKGILVASFSGVFSACFAMGLDAAAPLAELSAQRGTELLWTGLPKLVIVLLGGFTSNFIWCAILNVRNRTGYQYFSRRLRPSRLEPLKTAVSAAAADPPKSEPDNSALQAGPRTSERVPMLSNYCFSAWPASPGTCNFSSTPWARPRWVSTSSQAGPSTWPASSSSARSGASPSRNGRGRAGSPRRSFSWGWRRSSCPQSSSVSATISPHSRLADSGASNK